MTAGIALAAVSAMALAVLILVSVLLTRLGGYWGRAQKGNEACGFSIERY